MCGDFTNIMKSVGVGVLLFRKWIKLETILVGA